MFNLAQEIFYILVILFYLALQIKVFYNYKITE